MVRLSTFVLRRSVPVLLAVSLLFSCAQEEDMEPYESDGITLAGSYDEYFDIGAAVALGVNSFDSFNAYEDSLLAEFNSFTAENEMKPSVLRTATKGFSWSAADRLVAEAASRGARVRGHALVWHSQTPDWFAKTAASKEAARQNMKDHIEAVLARYDEDEVYCWDVVNEAISDGGDYRKTDSPWYSIYGGPEYIRDAFQFARDANPEVQLFYNDYNIVNTHKQDMIVKMIEDLKLIEDGLIDGVGIQAHWNINNWPSKDTIRNTINRFGEMGLRVHITELDLTGPESEQPLLANRYRDIFEVFIECSQYIDSVTFWGVADDHTWLNSHRGYPNFPFVFSKDHQRKAAYYSIRNLAE